ncbi:MAG: NADH-quinone oxidoreductase subunit NuoG [Gammaproteobacteria bacterium]
MVNIHIDGKLIQAKQGAMIIEAADEVGIPIARFCYHKKLSVAANCRMCLVEVEKASKPLPACATPVTEGMKVYTKSPRALDAQRGTMEFLLINHPLDCPICDQGGECELQDVALGYGGDKSRFQEKKRVVKDKELGSLISTDMTRCIHCTRCVRFGEEIAGIKELGATGRGEHMEIGTYVTRTVDSEMSGNVIDLCPVGALTSKPFRYTARPWELNSVSGIAPHDCAGSNIYLHLRRGEVMRVLPQENEAINETWISDRDRFSYEGLHSGQRLRTPMLRRDGQWQETDWETALDAVVTGFRQVLGSKGASQLGALVSPNATLEEMYLTQRLLRGLGSANVDHRLRQLDFSDQDASPAYPWLGMSIADLQDLDGVLLVGANIRKDQPIIGHRVRKAAMAGAKVGLIGSVDYEFRFPVESKVITTPAGMERALAGVVKVLLEGNDSLSPAVSELLADVTPDNQSRAIASLLRQGEKSAVLLGSQAAAHPGAARLRALAAMIGELSESTLSFVSDGANSTGAWLAGAVPHREAGAAAASRRGLDARAMLEAGLKAYMLVGVEPELDCTDSAAALRALGQADCVVALTSFVSDAMRDYAQVLLPMAPFSETSGTYVNIEGKWQSFTGAATPVGEARPGWKILRVLGNLFGMTGFDYMSSAEVRDEAAKAAAALKPDNRVAWLSPDHISEEPAGVVRLADVPLYAVDSVVRRSEPLQKTADAAQAAVYIHESTAKDLGLADGQPVSVRQGDGQHSLDLIIDNRIALGCVWIPAGVAGAAGLGAHGSTIDITQV